MIIVLDETYQRAIGGRFAGHEIRYYPQKFADAEKFTEMLADAHVLGMRRALPFPLDRKIIGPARNLQFIHKSGSGADHFDVDLLSELGILLGLNTGFNAVSVAEHAVALTLLCLRRTLDFIDVMREGGWVMDPRRDEPLLLCGKTVGIIGKGAIGSHYAAAMIGMGARVICYHPNPSAPMPAGVTWASLDSLMSTSDVVSVHVPLVPSTVKLIGAREIGLMKPTAVLINTSRGAVIDEPALVAALQAGRIRGAGLDVFEQEPLPADHPLRGLPNVVMTSHIGGIAKEVTERQQEGTLGNIELFLAGRRPERLVNPEILADGRARAQHLASPA